MKSTLLFVLITLCSIQTFSQVDTIQLYEIATSDGNRFIGSIIEETESEIILKTYNYGHVPIKKYLITERKPIQQKKALRKKKIAKSERTIPNEQTKDSLWRVVTQDGFDFVGTIRNYEVDAINLKTKEYGNVRILKVNINSISLIGSNQIIKGDVWFENPQATRYFFSPNGYGLKKNEGYYQNVWVLFNQVSFGFTDYFTMGVGTVPVFLFGVEAFPLWITPKLSLPIIENKLNVSVGLFTGAFVWDAPFALPYGTVTIGDRNKNLNIGGGYLATDGSNPGLFTASTMIRLNKRNYFISENFLLFDGESAGVLSAGGRTILPRISLDYGLFVPFGNGIDFIAVPWLGFVIPFHRK